MLSKAGLGAGGRVITKPKKKQPDVALRHIRPCGNPWEGLKVRVPGTEHSGESGRLHFAAFSLARLFKMPMAAHFFESPFTIDFLFQSPEGFIYRFTFFESDLSHLLSLPFC
jgi:hypothetical protein